MDLKVKINPFFWIGPDGRFEAVRYSFITGKLLGKKDLPNIWISIRKKKKIELYLQLENS